MNGATQTVQSPKRPVLPPRFRPLVRPAINRNRQYSSQGRWHALQQPAKQLQHNYLEESAPSAGLAAKPVALNSNNIVPLQVRALGSFDGKPTSLLTTSLVQIPGDSSDKIAQQTNTACITRDQQAQHALEDPNCSPASIQQQAQWRSNSNLSPGTGIWTRTAQLARLVSFPVRATRAYYSYVPFGQQLYLNPQAVATSLEAPSPSRPAAAASATAASAAVATAATPAEPAASAVATAEHLQNSNGEADAVPAALGDLLDVVVQQRREQLGRLWMHRMPTYRARFQQILFAALGLPLPASSQTNASQAEAVTLSKPIAPVIHVIKAETSCKALTSQHLKGILQVNRPYLLDWAVICYVCWTWQFESAAVKLRLALLLACTHALPCTTGCSQ